MAGRSPGGALQRIGMGSGPHSRPAMKHERASVAASSPIRASGMLTAPGIFSRACSSASRTSTSNAPAATARRASAGAIVEIVIVVSPCNRVVEGREQRLGPRIGDPVPERLALAAKGYQPLVAHLRQMLRQRRLRQRHIARQIANAHLAMLDQLAQHHQAAAIAHRLEAARRPLRLRRESHQIHRNLKHRTSLH
ncbi:hypothetical protein DdX_22077 [Ditylenchus destructor]|uniref:Uncharacterized protein n=1 Tax=Ditylenchus destructor TaxID=166010 RepID=A0AAD4MEV3_9BILA|nr:hypothetical protein DdX_22077 [Ditylenchus destructor]